MGGWTVGPSLEDLANNTTSQGLKVSLYAPHGPPFHMSESYMLEVVAFIESVDPLETNLSVEVLMGVDTLGPPDNETSRYRTSEAPWDGIYYGWYYSGKKAFQTTSANGTLMAQVTHKNETVNLTYDMVVLPPRVHLVTSRVYPSPYRGDLEKELTPVDILIENKGALGATEMVVDVVYMDRIVSTHNIPLIAAGGNRTITTSVIPLYNHYWIQVRLAKGPGAPTWLDDVSFNPVARPVLQVVDITAGPDVIESGEKVHIEAVVRNVGNLTSDDQGVEIMVDGTVVIDRSVKDLPPGNETTVSADWTLRGEGLHTVSAVAEGDEMDAEPITVEVKAKSPSVGVWVAVMALLLVSLAARRSRPGGRA